MIKNLLILFVFISMLIINSCNNYKEELWELVSPSGELMIRIELSTGEPSGRLYYSIYYLENEKEIIAIKKSPLGIINSKSDFTGSLEAVGSSMPHIKNFNYQMTTGKRKVNITSANCMEIEFLNSEKDTLIMKTMAFNDGIAFSYSIPGSGDLISIIDEITGFNIDPAGKAWIQPYDTVSANSFSYESGYINEMNIGLSSPNQVGWGFPALFKSNGLWILISEAGLNENYFEAHLSSDCKNGEYKIKYPSEKESLGSGSLQTKMRIPLSTPWRLVMVGKTLAPIVESNIVYHLSQPSIIKDTMWSYAATDFGKVALLQNTIYPFTSNIIGRMDYTPVTITIDQDNDHLSSNAHELALSIIFENGILLFADRMNSYDLPVKVIDFIKTVPVAWDNTWLLDGYPGKFVVLGRENNEMYFIAGINGEDNFRETKLIPGFLNDSIYNARLITDAADQKIFNIIDFEYVRGDTMSINMYNNGGFVLTLGKK